MKKNCAEKKVIEKMIRLYCRKKHCTDTICSSCSEIMIYSFKRIDSCRWAENKPNCSDCSRSCFSNEMKIRIREIMKFSGPRMLFHDPAAVFLWLNRKYFNKDKKE